MAPVLQKGLFCCVSLRTCALVLGSINLVDSVMMLALFIHVFVIGLNPEEGHGHSDQLGDLGHQEHPDYDSEAMDEHIHSATQLALAALWVNFALVLMETLAVILLLVGAAKRFPTLLLPWLGVEILVALYDIALFCYLFASGVYVAVDLLLPLILMPLTIYCWLVVFSLYQEFRETAARNEAMPLSALETGHEPVACTVPYGRMPSRA